MQIGFYFDQTRCHGCFTCSVACKDWHNVEPGPANWRRVLVQEEGKFPNLFVAFLTNACYHCANPTCAAVCPAKAITKREPDGIMVVDREKCQEAFRCGILADEGSPRAFPCKLACPAGVSVPGYLALAAQGKYAEALELMRQRLPLPSVCGRICHHPCEAECRRKDKEEPVAIAALKRFITDQVQEPLPEPAPRTKKEKVAIIGSGPAGLAAAHDLVKKGYGVTIFEAQPVAGGMLAVGLPEYRLPKKVLQRDIDYIRALGVEIKTNTPIGDGLTLKDLANQGYEAILIAVGAHGGQKLPIEGADLKGTLVGTAFLREVNLGRPVALGKKVLVIGGGNVAFDCARSALRLGAPEVALTCLESRETMPADPWEIEEGDKEGVVVYPSRTFTRMMGQKGHVAGVECLKLRWMKFDAEGKLHLEAIPGSEHLLAADTIIFAIGQVPALDFLKGAKNIQVTPRGTILVDPETLATTRPGVFACGDATGQTARVIEAIAAGQKAAASIERYLQGDLLRQIRPHQVTLSEVKVNIPADVATEKRQLMSLLPIAEREGNFREVELGFTEEAAKAEAARCLNCAGQLCREVCLYGAPQFGLEPKAKMQMCDLCLDRLAEGKKPICVDACPVYALDAGTLEELKQKNGDNVEAPGFNYSPHVKPSGIFKPRPVRHFDLDGGSP